MQRYRVVSYNVHACVGRDGAFRPDRIGDLLALLDADFIGLQEVEDRHFGQATVSRYLAERLDMHLYPGPTLLRDKSHYGNVLLSRQPAEAVRHWDLSVRGREPRGAIDASFALGANALRLWVTHFGLSARERARQIDQLAPALAADNGSVCLLLGDFNEWRPAARLYRTLRGLFGDAAKPRTFPAARPVLALDRIYARPVSAVTRVHAFRGGNAAQISDHLPVVATLSLPAEVVEVETEVS